MKLTKTHFEQNAKKLIEMSKKNFEIELDFSEKSLLFVDEIIGKHFRDKEENIVMPSILIFGSYLGEVIKKNLGGKWVVNDEIFKSEILIKDEKTKIQILPFVRVMKRFYGGDSIFIYYKKVKKAIDKYEVYG